MIDSPFAVEAAVEPGWVDYNGHLNMAYYHVIFDRALDDALDHAGLGADYRAAGVGTFFSVEVHVRYLAEVEPDARVRVSVRLVAHDGKRLHVFLEMHDPTGAVLHATSEQLLLHVDPAARKVRPFEADALARLQAWTTRDARLPPIDGLGRSISLANRKT